MFLLGHVRISVPLTLWEAPQHGPEGATQTLGFARNYAWFAWLCVLQSVLSRSIVLFLCLNEIIAEKSHVALSLLNKARMQIKKSTHRCDAKVER